MNYETYILHLVGSSDAIDKLAGIINSAVASVGENNFRGFHADGVFRRLVELLYDAGRRRSLQEQLGNQRVLCPDRRPGAEHQQSQQFDL